MRLLIILSVAIFMFSCSSSKKFQEENICISMEKTSCYGHCPVYTINIYNNGLIKLEGKENIDKIGSFRSKITGKQLDKLTELFISSDFFNFEDSYTSLVKDLPTTFIYFSKNNKNKRIKDYDEAPQSLKKLEEEIVLMLENLKWKIIKSK